MSQCSLGSFFFSEFITRPCDLQIRIISPNLKLISIFSLQENLVAVRKKLDIDVKYLELLGFTQPIYNGTRYNFTIVTYIQSGQAASAILLSQNIALKLPNEVLLIYNLGLSEDDTRALSAYCNNSKCSVITYDKLTEVR